jgi:hypothetical protein
MERRDRRYLLLCAAALVTAMALTTPVAESGMNDDWSYAKTALDLAQTGRLVYNGWASAMVGAQAYWGALFIKLFGFSFLTVRMSTAPLALGCCLLTYSLHRRAKLPPALAAFGTLTLCLSPVFIANAVSFMTDIPGLFLCLLSIYGFVRVAEVLDTVPSEPSSERRLWRSRFFGWLLLGLLAGVLGGSVRQVIWFVPMFAPLVLILRRRSPLKVPAVVVPLSCSIAVAIVSAFWISTWFNAQPYAIHEKLTNGLSALKSPAKLGYLGRQALELTLTWGVLILPVLLLLPQLYRKWIAGRSPVRTILPTALITTALVVGTLLTFGDQWYFPFIGCAFDCLPFMAGTAPIAPLTLAFTLPMSFWQGLSICVTLLVSGAITLWMSTLVWRRSGAAGPSRLADISPVVALLAVFAAAYIPVALFKSVVPDSCGLADRYLLPVIPLATVGLLGSFHRWAGREGVPALSWAVLGLLAFYGTAQIHDYFAQLRARVALTRYLEQHGVPRTQIMAGFEYDSWTQITVTKCYNDSRIENPKGVYLKPTIPLGFLTAYRHWIYAPVVRPDYVVGIGPHPGLFDTDLGPLEYDCWLPPLRRFLCVQVTDPARAVVSALAPIPARDLVQQ